MQKAYTGMSSLFEANRQQPAFPTHDVHSAAALRVHSGTGLAASRLLPV
jgi:hypothetical protein